MSQETWWNACTQSETLVKNEKYGSCLKLLTILFLPFYFRTQIQGYCVINLDRNK